MYLGQTRSIFRKIDARHPVTKTGARLLKMLRDQIEKNQNSNRLGRGLLNLFHFFAEEIPNGRTHDDNHSKENQIIRRPRDKEVDNINAIINSTPQPQVRS